MSVILTRPASIGTGTGSGETNTASNVNVGGVGVFKQKTGVNLEFRGINAGSSKITTVLDGPNNEIDIDFGIVTLDNLSDVIITGPTSSQILRFNGTNWVNAAILSTDITDFNEAAQDAVGSILVDSSTIDFTYNDLANTITAVVLTDTSTQRVRVVKNSGAVIGTRPELNFIEGSNVTLTIADDVGNNQVDITIASSGGASGYATIQEEGTSLTQRPTMNFIGSGITAVDDAGNTRTNISLDVDLNALADTVTTGLYTITGIGTSVTRTIVAGSIKITVTNGSGVAGNPSIDFGTVTLDNLSDVIITAPTSGQVVRFNGTDWVNAAITSTDITNFDEAAQDAVGTILTDSASIDFTYNDPANTITAVVINDTNIQRVEVVKNSGAVISTRKQLNFVEGANIALTITDDGVNNQADITIAVTGVVTGTAYQTVQEEGVSLTQRSIINFIGGGFTASDNVTKTDVTLDADLNAIAAFVGTGIAVRTAADTWAQRTLVAPAAGITITNPAGVAGDPTFALANDLGAIEALNTNGILTRTATDTFAARTITAGANITVTNGDGIAGNPTIALTGTIVNSVTLTQPAAGLTLTNTGVTQTGAVTSTFALANDLSALEGLGSTGIAVRTAADTWAQRTIVAGSTKITVTNGSGVAGDPSIDFGTVNLDDLADVVITTPTSGQLLRYNGTNWVNVNTNNVLRLYSENPSSETTPLVAGTNAVAVGTGSSASGLRAFALGDQSLARLQGEWTFANGSFAAAGDAQVRHFVVRTQTTNATITEAFLDGTGGTARMVLPNDTTWAFSVFVAARRTDADNESAGYDVSGVIDRNATAASTALVSAVSKSVLAEDNGPWDVTVDADTTNGSLRVRVTGQAAKTVRWVAYVRATEVTG